jgi:hypothetical protein
VCVQGPKSLSGIDHYSMSHFRERWHAISFHRYSKPLEYVEKSRQLYMQVENDKAVEQRVLDRYGQY